MQRKSPGESAGGFPIWDGTSSNDFAGLAGRHRPAGRLADHPECRLLLLLTGFLLTALLSTLLAALLLLPALLHIAHFSLDMENSPSRPRENNPDTAAAVPQRIDVLSRIAGTTMPGGRWPNYRHCGCSDAPALAERATDNGQMAPPFWNNWAPIRP
jgi:hypothetical protein